MPNQSPEFDPSPIEFLSRRLDALEDAVRALLREKWDLEYPPGHAERENRMLAFLKANDHDDLPAG